VRIEDILNESLSSDEEEVTESTIAHHFTPAREDDRMRRILQKDKQQAISTVRQHVA